MFFIIGHRYARTPLEHFFLFLRRQADRRLIITLQVLKVCIDINQCLHTSFKSFTALYGRRLRIFFPLLIFAKLSAHLIDGFLVLKFLFRLNFWRVIKRLLDDHKFTFLILVFK